jgi:hypothetical protein
MKDHTYKRCPCGVLRDRDGRADQLPEEARLLVLRARGASLASGEAAADVPRRLRRGQAGSAGAEPGARRRQPRRLRRADTAHCGEYLAVWL